VNHQVTKRSVTWLASCDQRSVSWLAGWRARREGTAGGAGRKTCFVTSLVVAPAAGIRVGAGAGIGAPSESEAGLGRNERIHRYANFLASVQTRCTTHAAALLAFVIREALGSRPAPGTLSAKRSVGTRRAASMRDTLSEGTARAAQLLAPSAVTASAVGGFADSLRRRAAPLRPRDRPCSSSSGSTRSNSASTAQQFTSPGSVELLRGTSRGAAVKWAGLRSSVGDGARALKHRHDNG
jgi:hypothetical protein